MKQVQFHSKKALVPRKIMDGACMWSVALENTMFTYFEIEPNSHFDLHCHDNEQITMVLEGELFFKLRKRLICLKKGDVIAIPSNMSHEVFTKNTCVIAVDAWSPVMEKYRHEKKSGDVLENERLLARCVGMKP